MSCQHGNWPPCDECDEIDTAWNRGYAAGKASVAEPEAHTIINHEREPHCIGCYVIRWNGGEPAATCNECGHRRNFIDLLAAAPAAPGAVGVDEVVQEVMERLDKVADYAGTIDGDTVVFALPSIAPVLTHALTAALAGKDGAK